MHNFINRRSNRTIFALNRATKYGKRRQRRPINQPYHRRPIIQQKYISNGISKKYNSNGPVYLFTNMRDESNIPEWIAHYSLLGIDKIIIFDHNSIIPIKSIIDKYNFPHVEVYRDETPSVVHDSIKIKFMKRAVEMAKNRRASWMGYLDADEFITLNYPGTIKHLLSSQFSKADHVSMNWLMFGSSHLETQPTDKLLMDVFTKSNHILDHHVKSFVRPQCVTDIINPHFFIINNPNRSYYINGNRHPVGSFFENKYKWNQVLAYVAHYRYQSIEKYKQRKGRIMDDGTLIPYNIHIHNDDNDVDNNAVSVKYSRAIQQYINSHKHK